MVPEVQNLKKMQDSGYFLNILLAVILDWLKIFNFQNRGMIYKVKLLFLAKLENIYSKSLEMSYFLNL